MRLSSPFIVIIFCLRERERERERERKRESCLKLTQRGDQTRVMLFVCVASSGTN